MGEDDFDWGSLFGGGDTDMSNFDMSGLDLGSLADLGGFDIGDLDLGNMDFGDLSNLDLSGFDIGDLGNFNVGDLDLGGMDFGGQNGIDIDSILSDLGGDVGGIDPKLLESITGYSPETSMSSDNAIQTALADNVVKNDFGNPFTEEQTARLSGQNSGAYLPSRDEATNVYDQEDMEAGAANQPQSIDDVIRQLVASSYDEDKYAQNNAALEEAFAPTGNEDKSNNANLKALEALMGGDLSSPDDISNLGMGDLATNAAGAYDQNYDTQNAEIQKLLGLHPTPAEKTVTPEPADTEQERELKSLINRNGIPDVSSNQNYAAEEFIPNESSNQNYDTESLQSRRRSDNEAIASGMGPGSLGAQRATDEDLVDNPLLKSENLAEAYGTSGKGSVYDPDIVAANALANKPKSIAEAIASGNAPGSVGAKMLANGQLNDEQVNALYGTGNGLASLTGVSKNKAIASGASPGTEGAKMLAEAASNSSSDNAFTPAEEAALFGKTPTNTSTGISKNEAIASGMSPGSEGAKAAAAGELTPEELAAAQGVVTKGSVYNPVTSAEKTADVLKKIADAKTTPAAKNGSNNMGMMMMLMALMAMMNKGGGGSGSSGATIPSLSADRKQLPYGGGSSSYRPGQGGVNYFTPTTYSTKAAGGGLMSLNGGGHLGGYSDGGRLLRGPGDGVSDSIPATIGGKQPARLATGEFVVPARIVSELGNGSTDAGAQRLYEMMDRVQHARQKTKNIAANTKAAKYLPA